MDLNQSLAQLTQARDTLSAVIQELAPPPVATPTPTPTPVSNPVQPAPQPAPAPAVPARGLQRIQAWLGQKTVGVYIGIEEDNWSPAQMDQAAVNIRAWGADYALVKIGEGANLWHGGDIAGVRSIFYRHGLGFAPYHYCLPGNPAGNVNGASKAASICGGVVLDVEDEFVGFDTDLASIFNGLRSACPDKCLIMSGYGDPHFRFGDNYPHHTIATAPLDGYQPQMYIGVWDEYKAHGYLGAFQWGINDVASVYGENCVIQPAISIQGIDPNDFEGMAAFLKNWKASLAIWEYQQCNGSIVAACKRGLNS